MLYDGTCIIFDARTLEGYSKEQFERLVDAAKGVCSIICLTNNDKESSRFTAVNVLNLHNDDIFFGFRHSKNIDKGIIPGNGDLKLIASLQFLKFDHFIRWEDDVFCFDPVQENLVDLIEATRFFDFCASYLAPFVDDNWMWWNTLSIPGLKVDEIRRLLWKAFLPVMTFRSSFLYNYKGLLEAGWSGHYEVTMVSAAKFLGASCMDLSRHEKSFIRFPQFGITKVQDIEKFKPKLVHPIKNHKMLSDLNRSL